MRVQKGLIGLIAILQSVLFLAHFLVYETWTFSPAGSDTPGALWIKLVLRLFVGELCCRFATCLSLYKCCCARVLQDCCGLVGSADFPLLRRGFLLDYFRSCAAGWAGRELPSDGGMAVRRCSSGRTLRGFQRKLDANHANDGAARELAAGVARAKSGADQRPAPGACAKRQFSAAHGCEDFEGRAGRDFYCGRFV